MRIRAVDMRTAANCSCILATRSIEEGKGGGGTSKLFVGGGGGYVRPVSSNHEFRSKYII